MSIYVCIYIYVRAMYIICTHEQHIGNTYMYIYVYIIRNVLQCVAPIASPGWLPAESGNQFPLTTKADDAQAILRQGRLSELFPGHEQPQVLPRAQFQQEFNPLEETREFLYSK